MIRIPGLTVAAALVAAVAAVSAAPAAAQGSPGAVYALTNSPAGNAVAIFERAADGSLTAAGTVATGGAGTGAGLGSQGAVVLSDDGRWLLAVNAGSDSVSSFAVRPDGLALADVAPSGGSRPTSVTIHGDTVYVLNAGAPNSISGLRIDAHGGLTPIAGSTRPLSADQTSPAQVEFTPQGDALVVTERATNLITTFAVAANGVAGAAASYASGGVTPFGFAFGHRGRLFVSDAGGQSGASSYAVGDGGVVTTVTALAPTGQRAACWAVVTKDGRFGYVTNAATGNVSGFAIDSDGALALLDADGVTATTGGNPTDAALSGDSRYLFVRNGNGGAINVFRIEADGSLTPLPGIASGLAGTAAGIAAR